MAARGMRLAKLASSIGSRRGGSVAHYSSRPNTLMAAGLDDLAAGEKKGGGGGAVVLGLLLLGGGGAGYYYYTHPEQVPDYVKDNIPASIKEVLPRLKEPTLLEIPPLPEVTIDPKEEFLKRVDALKAELEELRKEKKVDKFIALKKKEVKEELKIVQKAINDLVESIKDK